MTKSIPHNVPSSGTYETTDRLTKIRVSSNTFEGLLNRIYAVRGAIGAVSGSGLREELEKWICEEHPEECTEVDMNIPRKRNLMLSDVLHGTRVMVAFKFSGNPLVDREEAMRRGEICKNCQFNRRFDKPCTGWCSELQSMVHSIIGHQGLPVDAYLHACTICACFNAAHIWLPLDILDKGLTDEMRAQFASVKHCWKKTRQCDTVKE